MDDKSYFSPLTGPPCVSYDAFERLLREFANYGVPAKLDADAYSSFSQSVAEQLAIALRRLGLATAEGDATDNLREIVSVFGSERYGATLLTVLDGAYPFLRELDLGSITPAQFAEQFAAFSNSHAVQRKMTIFYLKAAMAGGAVIGRRLQFGRRLSQKPPIVTAGANARNNARQIRASISLMQDIIRKYPEFDEDWSEPVKLAWLEGMSNLMATQKEHSG